MAFTKDRVDVSVCLSFLVIPPLYLAITYMSKRTRLMYNKYHKFGAYMELVMMPSRNSLLLRSIINIIFGLLILLFPSLTLTVLAIAFAVNLLVIGLFMIFEPAFDKDNRHAILTVLLGLLSVSVGVYIMSRPLAGITILSILLAAWALLFGITDLFLGFKLTEAKINGSWLFTVVGVLSIMFAIYLAFNPLEGSLALVWIVGVYALALGVFYAIQLFTTRPKQVKSKKKKGKK